MAEHRLGKGYFTCIKVAEVNRFVFLLTVCFVGFNKTTSSSFFFFFLLSFFFPPFRSSCGYAVSRLISLSLFALIGFMEANSALRETCKKQPCVLATLFFFFFEQHKAEYRRGSCLLCHGLRRKPSVTTVIEPSAFFSFFFFTCLCGDVNGDKNHLLRALCMQHNQNYEKSVFVTLFYCAVTEITTPRVKRRRRKKRKPALFL